MKKLLWIAFFLALFLFLFTLLDTYSLLQTRGSSEINPEIGKWHILLNNIDVTKNKIITLNDLIYEQSENTENGYFAPGSIASYEIIIDPKDTDVSIEYDISMDLDELEAHPNIIFKATDKDGIDLNNDGTNYGGIIPLSMIKNNEKITVKISLVWQNDEQHNNSDNELIGIKSLNIPITIKFAQYTG